MDVKDLIQGKLVAVKPNDTWASKSDTTGEGGWSTCRFWISTDQRVSENFIAVLRRRTRAVRFHDRFVGGLQHSPELLVA